jgi:integrase
MAGKPERRVGVRGVSWQLTVELPPDPDSGKRRQKLLTAPTKHEVEALAVKLRHSINSNQFGEAEANKMTVEEHLTRWLETVKQVKKVGTYTRYAHVLNHHVIPTLGRTRLAKLSPPEIQTLYATKLEKGLSSTTVLLIHNVLHRALKQAVRWNLIVRNPTEFVDPPQEATREYKTWDKQQLAAFLAASDKHVWFALWRLAALTGMRRGEVLGLMWSDLDFERGLLSVKRTLSRGVGGAYSLGTPKTAHGRRSLVLPKSVLDSLHKHRRMQLEERLAMGETYQDNNFVFASAIGEPLHPNTIGYNFSKIIAAANLPRIRFHDLRHTSATLMLLNGEHPKIVQERLGHADVSITLNRYSHVTMSMQKEAADRLDALLRDAS